MILSETIWRVTMTNVWYVGRYGKRQLSAGDWAQLGVVTTKQNEWSLDNGWSLPESDFTPTQLSILASMDEFQTGQDGPRIKTPSPAITGGSSPFSIYFEKMKFLFDNFFTLKSAFDSQYFSLITSLKPEVWHDFTNDPNGIPVNVDSGGSWTVHVDQSKNDLVVQSGLLVLTDTVTTTLRAGYAQKQLASAATYLEGEIKFTSTGSSEGSAICFAAFVSPLPTFPFNSPCHLVTSRNSITWGVFVDGVFTILRIVNFSAPLVDGKTYHVEAAWDSETKKGWMRDPFGVITEISYDPALGVPQSAYDALAINANWTFCEPYYSNASTDSRVGVSRFASDSNPLATQAKSPTKAQLLRAQGLLQNAFVTLAGIQTLVNKTINAPKINYILDANGRAMFNMLPTVNAVNYLQLQNNVTTGPPVITAAGSDANIDIAMAGKGIGQVKAYNGTQYSRVLTAQPRLQAISTGATHTINVDTADFFGVTAQNVAATIAAPTGTPTTGQVLRIRLQDNGTSQSLTWDAIWRAVGITLPTATIAGKVMYLIAVWNAGAVKWDVIDLKVQA